MNDLTNPAMNRKLKTLRPKKYTEQEFFIADEMAITTFRDELASMEHPFFGLKGGDTKVRVYKNSHVTLTIRPAAEIGLATVFDKDIWIYAISKLQQAIFEENRSAEPSPLLPMIFLSQQTEIKVVGLMKN